MLPPTDLIEKIKQTKRKYATFIVGIDGVGGAGKTTLSRWLREHLDNVSIVQLDDFYSPDLRRADRYRVLKQVFLPLDHDLDARYQVFNWRRNALTDWFTIKLGEIVIVEWVSALHSDFVERYDFKIWIECPPEEGFRRGIERDMARDHIDNSEIWREVWMPQEKEYVELEKPQLRADYILMNGW